MSRELQMDFSIQNGEMSQYRDKSLGYIVINFEDSKKQIVEEYLNHQNVIWRYYKSVEE